jgi:hypothetical protein
VGHQRAAGVERFEFPAPEVTRRGAALLRRLPGDQPAFVELDHVVLPDRAVVERHGEDVTDAAHALTVRRMAEVVVAVPLGLARGVGDELEDRRGGCGDLPTGIDHSFSGHPPIPAHNS